MSAESAKPPAGRRTFLAGTGAAAAGTAAAALLGGPLAGTPPAAGAGFPPEPIGAGTKSARGPPVHAAHYFLGQITGDHYVKADSFSTDTFATKQCAHS